MDILRSDEAKSTLAGAFLLRDEIDIRCGTGKRKRRAFCPFGAGYSID